MLDFYPVVLIIAADKNLALLIKQQGFNLFAGNCSLLPKYVRKWEREMLYLKKIKFMLRYDQKGRGFHINSMELYGEVNKRLISKQIATSVEQDSDPREPLSDGDILHMEVPYLIKNDTNSSNLTIENIKTALKDIDLFDNKSLFSNVKITEEN
ncbi:hypothetical protein Ga0466249_002263 [Sporomusaceae bacterium BoRhaA]|uniref:hypothetical protein n=1 Tax=Pelorhabdus rhamnosifermentans TaxID=2772457 RepID=UPI001C0625AD|nr:hypothetical protein [Pelorhabdus rhamnosifermentans]MBU2701149.1 hypothetical protein [Pelorhabdus rhamnosifermentans]